MSEYSWKGTVEDLEKVFDSLEISIVVKRALNYLSTKIQCENIIWSMEPGITATQDQLKPLEPEKLPESGLSYTTQATMEESKIVEILKKFDLPESYLESTDNNTISCREGEGESNYLIPIRDPKTHCLLSVIVFYRVPMSEKHVFISRVEFIVKLMKRHLAFSVEYSRVKQMSFVDDVTELFNQRYLPMVLDKEISRSKRYDKPFTVMFLDIDYFKMVNDTRGHLVGSKILVEVAKLIKTVIRKNDYAFRYGGDEFVIMLTETDVKSAEIVAERIRKKVEDSIFKIDGPELKITVSIGLASFPEHAKTSEQVIQLADQAMYNAKNKSRNVVYVTAS